MLNNSLISRIKIDVTNSRSQKLKKNQLYGDLNITNTLSVEYIPLELYNDLHNYTVIESYTIKCKYDNNVIVTMLSKRRLSKTFLKNLHTYIFCTMNLLATSTLPCSTNILYINYNGKKKFPFDINSTFEPVHTNSAYTYINSNCVTEFNIVIYRSEEVYKSIIHELIHYCNYDSLPMDTLNIQLASIFKSVKQHRIKTTETYTESLATYLNCILIYVIKKHKDFNKLFKKEQSFSIRQTRKILQHFSMKKFIDLYNYEYVYKESTHVLSYHILKSACICNKDYIDVFLKNVTILNYDTFQTFQKLLFESIKNIKWVDKINKYYRKYKLTNSSLRMTINDIS